jgi:hypothetical protein
MVSPFGTNLPLTPAPYYSRVSNNYSGFDVPKNYYILGFNPGYALQASELNEVQENFFLNLNLTQRMNANWSFVGYKIPFWQGAIPLSPTQVTSTPPSVVSGAATFTISCASGWYLWTEPSSRMSFWIYIDSAISQSFTTTQSSHTIGFVGTSNETILCCPNDTCDETQDSTLRDNSQGDTNTHNTCGASRKNMTISSLDIRDGLLSNNSTFFPILYVTVTASTVAITFADTQNLTDIVE